MEHLSEILHELIRVAASHGLGTARAAELHDLADKASAAAQDVAEVTQDVAAVTETAGGTPGA